MLKAHRLFYHSILGVRVIKRKKKKKGKKKKKQVFSPPHLKQFDNSQGSERVKGVECLQGSYAARRPQLALRLFGLPREQKMLKGHLPRVIYHRIPVYEGIC